MCECNQNVPLVVPIVIRTLLKIVAKLKDMYIECFWVQISTGPLAQDPNVGVGAPRFSR